MAEVAVAVQHEPILLSDVFWQRRQFHFQRPYEIQPSYDPEMGMLFAEIPEIGVMSWGKTERELLDDLSEDIYMTWKLYATADDDLLAPDAQEVKQAFHSLIQEIDVASATKNR